MLGATAAAHPEAAPYLARYRFHEPPFLTRPDARFVYRSASFGHAMDAIVDAIAQGTRLIVVTGDGGVGKTTLCLELARSFPTARLATAPFECFSEHDLHDRGIADPAALARTGILVVDDAHELDAQACRELLADGCAGEQLILVGPSRVRDVLQAIGVGPGIAADIALDPMSPREVRAYVERRLWVARGGLTALASTDPRFSRAAIRLLAEASRGNPRHVNVLSDAALAVGWTHRRDRIGARLMQEVICNAGLSTSRHWRAGWTTWVAVGGTVAGLLLGILTVEETQSARARAVATAAAPLASQTMDERAFDAFRHGTLQRAGALAAVPDVKALLQLRDDVVSRQDEAGAARRSVVAELIAEVDRLTNEARARQLAVDRQRLLDRAAHRDPTLKP
jgi:MSHA biogenesis protein MshM